MTKKDKSGRYFQVCYATAQKAQFSDAYTRFWFWCSKHGRWQFISWGQVLNLRQGPKEQKNMVPMNPEGGARTALLAPRLAVCYAWRWLHKCTNKNGTKHQSIKLLYYLPYFPDYKSHLNISRTPYFA